MRSATLRTERVADRPYYLVRLTPGRFALRRQVLEGRTGVTAPAEAGDVVTRGAA